MFFSNPSLSLSMEIPMPPLINLQAYPLKAEKSGGYFVSIHVFKSQPLLTHQPRNGDIATATGISRINSHLRKHIMGVLGFLLRPHNTAPQ